MYDSLREWMDVPLTVKPFSKRTGTGDKVFGEPIDVFCYPKGEVTVVRNWQGVEVVSNTSLYVDGTVSVSNLDEVVFEGENKPVQAVSTFYRNGVPDLRVVYI